MVFQRRKLRHQTQASVVRFRVHVLGPSCACGSVLNALQTQSPLMFTEGRGVSPHAQEETRRLSDLPTVTKALRGEARIHTQSPHFSCSLDLLEWESRQRWEACCWRGRVWHVFCAPPAMPPLGCLTPLRARSFPPTLYIGKRLLRDVARFSQGYSTGTRGVALNPGD